MTHDEPSIIIHDTLIVVRANPAALVLFRAEPDQMIGVPLVDLIYDPDLRGLASLRMQIARHQPERNEMPDVEYLFRRFDRTLFFGRVTTSRLDTPGEWESVIKYLYDRPLRPDEQTNRPGGLRPIGFD